MSDCSYTTRLFFYENIYISTMAMLISILIHYTSKCIYCISRCSWKNDINTCLNFLNVIYVLTLLQFVRSSLQPSIVLITSSKLEPSVLHNINNGILISVTAYSNLFIITFFHIIIFCFA